MPPNIGHNIRNQNVFASKDYNEEKFLIYSVFREKILDKVLREQIELVINNSVADVKYKKEQAKQRRIKSQENLRDEGNLTTNRYEPTDIPLIENRYLDYNFQKEIMKKKHMLDLMMQKKMSHRKKNIIRVYGKDMLAEMYLDLLNITEGEKIPGKILSPLSGRAHKTVNRSKSKKKEWNNDPKVAVEFDYNKTFRLTHSSMFDQPNTSKITNDKQKHSRSKSNHKKSTNKPKMNQTFTANAPDKKSVQIYRKKMKSPMNLLRALGIYKKSNLLDEVLKMYKRAAGDYNDYQGNGPFSDRKMEGYEGIGGLNSLEQTTIADSNTKYGTNNMNRTIQSPQPVHKRLYSPPVKVGGVSNLRGFTQTKSKRNYIPIRQMKGTKQSDRNFNAL